MKTSWIRSTSAAVATAMLAAWAAPAQSFTIVTPEYLARGYQPDLVRQTAAAGGLAVDVRGGETVDGERLARATVAAVRAARLGRAAPLRVDPATAAGSSELVVVFDPAVNTRYHNMCQGERATRGDSLATVRMTLCHDGAPVSSVTAHNSGVADPGGAAFTALVSRAATALYPRRDGDQGGDAFHNRYQRN